MDIKANVFDKLSLVNIGLTALVVKTLVLPDFATSICLMAFASVYTFQTYLNKKETDRFEEISKEIKQLRESELAELKSALTALKLNQGIKVKNEQQAGPQQPKRFF